eukprot:gene21245-27528_t
MRDVPILAVDIPSLNEQKQNSHSSLHASPITRGLTLSTVGQIRHMSRGLLQWDRYTNNYISLGPPEIVNVQDVREVSAVLVLYGLPRDLTASILAHEAMHVYIKLNKSFPDKLDSKTEE